MLAILPAAVFAADTDNRAKALRNIQRSMDIVDAAWKTSVKGTPDNMYMVDTYNTKTGAVSGPSDVWPYTAAIEAHCSLLEALQAARDIAPELYAEKFDLYKGQLDNLIDNLEYYRGTYRLSSYATSNKEWSPFAVPRAGRRGEANVTGILNVYDDQMWLSRELVRAYRITGNENYLNEATYLADYVLEGWDCWRDENGEEYGGITWGPGYNSKHACSNAPMIQPLVWLSDIYKDSDASTDYYFRDDKNYVKKTSRSRSEHYLDFAKKIYNWQKSRLKHSTGVYWDMMGADNTIKVARGYRQHVDCGNPTGSFISYNTGTMISGAAELYRVTGDPVYLADMTESARGALNEFATYVRRHNTYEFKTDNTAEAGFNSWFNDVLMRSYVDAIPYVENSTPRNALNSFQTTLDYAFENHNRNNLLPIHLLDGWGEESITKGFHQFSFASEYALLAAWLLANESGSTGITAVAADAIAAGDSVYTISGTRVGEYGSVSACLSRGVYIVGSRKLVLGN